MPKRKKGTAAMNEEKKENDKFIVCLEFYIEAEDILVAEKIVRGIAVTWGNKPIDCLSTVRRNILSHSPKRTKR